MGRPSLNNLAWPWCKAAQCLSDASVPYVALTLLTAIVILSAICLKALLWWNDGICYFYPSVNLLQQVLCDTVVRAHNIYIFGKPWLSFSFSECKLNYWKLTTVCKSLSSGCTGKISTFLLRFVPVSADATENTLYLFNCINYALQRLP